MTLDELLRELQNRISGGTVLIIGSGLSAAEGVPGMVPLATHLLDKLPAQVNGDENVVWSSIAEELASGTDLESALSCGVLPGSLVEKITNEVAKLLIPKEAEIIGEVLLGRRVLPLTRLIQHLMRTNNVLDIVTPNYDRLIEVASEQAGFITNTQFCGSYCGRHDENRTRDIFTMGYVQSRKTGRTVRKQHSHVCVHKPHGSLDWYDCDSTPVHCPLDLPLPRLIVPPGSDKYRRGYDQPFDRHREKANTALDKARNYVIIGYGFNDAQLETHLCPNERFGKPSLILTKSLSKNAERTISSRDCIALSQLEDGDGGTRVHIDGESNAIDAVDLWSLGGFMQTVMGEHG